MTTHKTLIRSIKLSPSQRKQIADVSKQIAAYDAVVAATEADRLAWDVHHSKLHFARDAAYDALAKEFTIENAEKFHAAEMRLIQADKTAEAIGALSHQLYTKLSATLRPIVDDVFHRAAEAVKAHAADATAKLDPSNPFDDGSQIAAQSAQWLAGFEHERQFCDDALAWLQRSLDLE